MKTYYSRFKLNKSPLKTCTSLTWLKSVATWQKMPVKMATQLLRLGQIAKLTGKADNAILNSSWPLLDIWHPTRANLQLAIGNWQLASSLLTAVVVIIASRPPIASAYTIELISIAGWSLVLRPYNAPGAVNRPSSPSPTPFLVFNFGLCAQSGGRKSCCLSKFQAPSSRFQVRLTDCLVGWLLGWLVG